MTTKKTENLEASISNSIIANILLYIPHKISEYREPFFTNTKLLFHIHNILKLDVQKYWINDSEYDSYIFWDGLRKNNVEISKLIRYYYEQFYNFPNQLYELYKDDLKLNMSFDDTIRPIILSLLTNDKGEYSKTISKEKFTESAVNGIEIMCNTFSKNVYLTNRECENAILIDDLKDTFYFIHPPKSVDISLISNKIRNLVCKYIFITEPENLYYIQNTFTDHLICSLKDKKNNVEKIMIANYDIDFDSINNYRND